MAQINIAALRENEQQGLITCRAHPVLDLLIWNYTTKCQYEHAWDEITLQARGLITTADGTIIGKSFNKFFNAEEHQEPLPLEPFTVTEKMDGSLIIATTYQNALIVATRGSFASEQAGKAREIIQKRYSTFHFLPDFTYLFEVIYPQNRIVVDYGVMEDLVLLAMIHTETGAECDLQSPLLKNAWPFPLVKHYDGITDFTELKALEQANHEGFVIRFESGLRVKIKIAEYVRLHRLLTQCTARTIWELLKTGQSFDAFLDRVPDEFYAWVKQIREGLEGQYRSIEASCKLMVEQVKDLPTRKEQAAIVTKHAYRSIVFSMLDNKNYGEAIWKLLYPEATRPFRQDEEG
jgi:RNA ligase